MSDDAFVVGSIKKGKNEEVQIAIKEYKGVRYCDIRLWFQGAGGEYKPTAKGVTVGLKSLGKLSELVTEAIELAKDRGWTSAE